MKLAKIYGLLWLMVAVAGIAVFLTGSFGSAATMIFGFIVSILTGAALLVVFPVLMSEHIASETRGTV